MIRNSQTREDVSQFFDLQATVDGYEESEDEEEDLAAFLVSDAEEDENNNDPSPPLDWRDEISEDLEQVTERLRNTYQTRSHSPPTDDVLALPPTAQDAGLWMMRTKDGSEAITVLRIMEQQFCSTQDGPIISAFAIPSLPGRIYVEGRNSNDVWHSCSQISSVHTSKGMTLVSIEERIGLLTMRHEDRKVKAQSWVRLRRGQNKGDLAYVLRSSANSDHVQVAVLPRIPFSLSNESAKGKRKHEIQRIAARLFDPDEMTRVHGPDKVKPNGEFFTFQGKTFLKGMHIINVQAAHAVLRVPCPPLAEIKPFIDAGFITPAAALAMASSGAHANLQPGDYVELIAGEQASCRAMVVTCHEDVAVVDIESVDRGLNSVDRLPFLLEIPLKHIKRVFRIGDSVRVKDDAPEHAGSSGWVVAILDGGKRLCFVEDKTKNTIEVLSISVVSCQPDYIHGKPVNAVPDSQSRKPIDPLVGKHVLVAGKSYYKGYVGYVRSVAAGIAHIALDANHRIPCIPLNNVIDFSNGKTLAGAEIPPEWRQGFCKALRDYFTDHNPRPVTPPPEDTPFYSSATSAFEESSQTLVAGAFSVTYDNLKPYDGPGKWLLEYLVCSKFDTDPILVRFKTEYDGGRWSGRTAKTLKSCFITESPGSREVALTWTGNKAEIRSANVHIQYLEPARPVLNKKALNGP